MQQLRPPCFRAPLASRFSITMMSGYHASMISWHMKSWYHDRSSRSYDITGPRWCTVWLVGPTHRQTPGHLHCLSEVCAAVIHVSGLDWGRSSLLSLGAIAVPRLAHIHFGGSPPQVERRSNHRLIWSCMTAKSSFWKPKTNILLFLFWFWKPINYYYYDYY